MFLMPRRTKRSKKRRKVFPSFETGLIPMPGGFQGADFFILVFWKSILKKIINFLLSFPCPPSNFDARPTKVLPCFGRWSCLGFVWAPSRRRKLLLNHLNRTQEQYKDLNPDEVKRSRTEYLHPNWCRPGPYTNPNFAKAAMVYRASSFPALVKLFSPSPATSVQLIFFFCLYSPFFDSLSQIHISMQPNIHSSSNRLQ